MRQNICVKRTLQKLYKRHLNKSSITMKAKVHIVNRQFVGVAKETDFTLKEENLPSLKDGEFLAEAVYLSVDPYMRAFLPRDGVGKSLFAEQVAKILDSKNPKYPIGSYVIGEFGWRTHTIASEKRGEFFPFVPRLVPESDFKPLSLALGMLGMPGNTAYFGFLDLCKPKSGDTVLITAAAGAVGSHVGQLAKIKGCQVIGVTGSKEKCEWITNELKFDKAINYKDNDFEKKLIDATPNEIDIYYDNVGGELSKKIYERMKINSKIAICGTIATYNNDPSEDSQPPPKQKLTLFEQVDSFIYKNRWDEGINQNRIWLKEGKLIYKETITKGFENMPKAFLGLFQGHNIGKSIIQV